MDNLQCFNSLIFNSSKSPDSAKDNGSNRPPGEPEPSGANGATAPGNLSATAVQSSGVHKVPAVNHGMPVPFSAVQAPVTPNMAHLPWMTSRSVLFVAERDDRGFAPTRVGTELRVDVSLDNLGDGLGLDLGGLEAGDGRDLLSSSKHCL